MCCQDYQWSFLVPGGHPTLSLASDSLCTSVCVGGGGEGRQREGSNCDNLYSTSVCAWLLLWCALALSLSLSLRPPHHSWHEGEKNSLQ